jgi:hypothetical protein
LRYCLRGVSRCARAADRLLSSRYKFTLNRAWTE